MAQLPPKIPMAMGHIWPNSFSAHQTPADQQQRQSWDDFADFATARRGSHRRSASDSVAFLDPFINSHHDDDDEHLMMMSCMFSAVDMSSSNAAAAAAPPSLSPSTDPSSPSDGGAANNSYNNIIDLMITDNNDINDLFNGHHHPKSEPGEAESSSPPCESAAGDHHAPPPPLSPAAGDSTVFDPKRVKRILANRQSAQRSRVRKLQYISELERSVTTLQSEVSALSPRVAFLDHQRLILNVDNSALKQRIAALAQDKIFKDAHQEALTKEIERLRQVYQQQNLKKMANHNSQDQNSDNTLVCTDNDL